MPWIPDEAEDKIQTALGMEQLSSLSIQRLKCKSWVANEFLDAITSYDMPDKGLDKLILSRFEKEVAPFEEEVLSRLINMSITVSHLELSAFFYLTEVDRMQIVSLFRQIVSRNPPLKVLNMGSFSIDGDKEENVCEHIFEALLSSDIDSITDLNLSINESWYMHPETKEDR